MKKISLIVSILALNVALGYGQSKKGSISGQVSNLKKTQTKIYLVHMVEKPIKIDSVTLENGKFNFNLNIQKPDFYRVLLEDKNYVTLVCQPGQKITLNSDATDMQSNATLAGSPESEAVLGMLKNIRQYEVKLDSLEKVYAASTGQDEKFNNELIAQYEGIDKEKQQKITDFAKMNKGNLGIMFLLNYISMDDNLDLCTEIDNVLFAKYPDNFFVKDFNKKVSNAKKLAIGAVAPEIKLSDPEGNLKALSEFRGKVVLIDFWASWCSPCRKENPNVVKIYNKYKDKGFDIVSVSLDRDKAAWTKAIADDKLAWNHLSDLKFWQSQAARDYNVESIPFTVLIDKEGKIIGKGLRGEKLEEKLKEIFGE